MDTLKDDQLIQDSLTDIEKCAAILKLRLERIGLTVEKSRLTKADILFQGAVRGIRKDLANLRNSLVNVIEDTNKILGIEMDEEWMDMTLKQLLTEEAALYPGYPQVLLEKNLKKATEESDETLEHKVLAEVLFQGQLGREELDAIKRLLRSSWMDVDYVYDDLTPKEKACVSRAEFEKLRTWIFRG